MQAFAGALPEETEGEAEAGLLLAAGSLALVLGLGLGGGGLDLLCHGDGQLHGLALAVDGELQLVSKDGRGQLLLPANQEKGSSGIPS